MVGRELGRLRRMQGATMVRASAPKSICQAVSDSSSTRWRARSRLTMMALLAQGDAAGQRERSAEPAVSQRPGFDDQDQARGGEQDGRPLQATDPLAEQQPRGGRSQNGIA